MASPSSEPPFTYILIEEEVGPPEMLAGPAEPTLDAASAEAAGEVYAQRWNRFDGQQPEPAPGGHQ